MALYLLDSDAVIDYLIDRASSVRLLDELYEQGERLATCDVVVAEVYEGLHPSRAGQASTLLASMEFLGCSFEIGRQAERWRYEFALQGRALPVTDTLVAATALAHAATIVTANLRDYPMPELSLLPLPR